MIGGSPETAECTSLICTFTGAFPVSTVFLKTPPDRSLVTLPPLLLVRVHSLSNPPVIPSLAECVWQRALLNTTPFQSILANLRDTRRLPATMRSFALTTITALAALLPTALCQTYTSCDPLNTTGCPNMPALGGNATFNFNQTWDPSLWVKKNQGDAKWTSNGTSFTVGRRGDAPYIQSNFYLFFGHVEIYLRAAHGQGIVSSAILQSECLDEIDWEFLGSNNTHVLTNYFGKGNTTDYTRGKNFHMDFAPQDDFHNYTIDWTKDRIQWWVDGKMLRELKFAEALGGKNYPQTPMNIRLGAWSGGDASNNDKYTVEWAGGETDFSKGPFTMMVQRVYAKDYTTAKEYSWENMDASGSYEKVKVVE